jgi:hypothetical protein
LKFKDRLHRLVELIPWNRFLGSLKVKNSGSEKEMWKKKEYSKGDETIEDKAVLIFYILTSHLPEKSSRIF